MDTEKYTNIMVLLFGAGRPAEHRRGASFIMQKIEELLLSTGDFETGEALTKYCRLIKANQNTKLIAGQTQSHHILPRAWHKLHNKKLDNSKTNLVNLSISDHAKAHLFLFQAATNPEVRSQNAAAVRYMCNLFSEELIDEYADALNQVNLEVSKAKSKALAERRATGLNERRRAVMCIETGQVFKTVKEAQDTLHLFIKNVLNGTQSHAGGYHFKYLDAPAPVFEHKISRFTKEELEILKRDYPDRGENIPELLLRHSSETIRCKASELKLIKKHSNKCPVICIETAIEYPTITSAAKSVNVSVSNISKAIKTGRKSGGYHWEYVENK